MSEMPQGEGSAEAVMWARKQLDGAVGELTRIGIVSAPLVEARPVWTLPFQVMIGQIRGTDERTAFKWIIGGNVPIDHIDFAVASTPREAARHFALKWQIDAARYRDPSLQNELGPTLREAWNRMGENLENKAEALYALAETEELWDE